MKVYFFNVAPWEREFLEKNLKDISPELVEDKLSDENAGKYADAEIISVFVGSSVSRDVMNKMPNLKMIATRSTGFDHIDLEAAAERGIVVSNVPYYGENTVAEHAFALLLAVARKIFQSYERTEKFDFDYTGLTGVDLKGKTLGVIGMGHIGQYSARIGNGFGMKVIAYDIYHNEELAKEIGFEYVENLDELLERSDFITLHAPYNEHTHHMINMENVKKIKRGAILVNTARGALVETEALIWALENGILSGAGLDVLEGEPEIKEEWEIISRDFDKEQMKTLIMNHVLIERDDVIITPHNAFNTKEAIERILQTTKDNIDAYLGGNPQNVVKAKK